MHRGYIKFWRSTKDSWARKDPHAFHLFVAFFLLEAVWQENFEFVLRRGEKLILQPGEVVFGRKRASEVCGMTEKAVRLAVRRLENRESIRKIPWEDLGKRGASVGASTGASLFTVYYVVNWDSYQGNELHKGPAPWEALGRRGASTGATEVELKEGKEELELKNPSSSEKPDDGFATFWGEYPRKTGKGAAQKSWSKRKPPLQKVLAALRQQKESVQWKRERGRFIPHPATWLNQSRWEDEPDDVGGGVTASRQVAERLREMEEQGETFGSGNDHRLPGKPILGLESLD